MANLPSSDESSVGEYSESFEFNTTNSGKLSSGCSLEEVYELKKTLINSESANLVPDSDHPPLHAKKPPAPTSRRLHGPSDGGVNLSRTVRSPIAMAHHVHQNGALTTQRTNDVTTGSGADSHLTSTATGSTASPPPLSNSDQTRPLRFKEVVGTVQKLQSSSKKFKNSDEIREVVFKEWLAKKEVKDVHARNSVLQSRKTETDYRRNKELELSQRSVEVLQKWTVSKGVQLQSKQRQLSEEAKKKAEEAEGKLRKTREGIEAAKAWREKKGKRLSQIHREKNTKEKEEGRRKEEEKEEKHVHNKQAFEAWSQHKDKSLKEKTKKKMEQTKKLESTQKQKTYERQIEAKKSFEGWKTRKDEKINSAKMLFTYNRLCQIHESPWCPARSMEHAYPKTNNSHKPKPKPKTASHLHSTCSYSTCSFESEVSKCTEDSSTASSIMESVSRTTSPIKGRHKTIQVCCQTLQYWCTCDDHQMQNGVYNDS